MTERRLLTFGCSRTFGQGLSDCRGKDGIGPGPEPSKLAWPSLLATDLNYRLYNLSRPGSSNKEIWHTIMQTNFLQDDLVVVYWSHNSRSCVFSQEGIHKDQQIGPWQDTKQSKAFYSLYNDYEGYMDFNLRSMFIDKYLQTKKVDAFFIKQCYNKDIETPRNSDLCEWNTTNFVSFSLENYNLYPKADDNLHPGEEANKKFAEQLYKEITNEIKI